MENKYKILAKFVKDMSSETPDIDTYLFVKDNISKYALNIDIKSKFLKEKVGWKRWTAILLGFIGILIILKPGIKDFDPYGLLALFSAFLYAIYQILTRVVSRYDNTSASVLWKKTEP